MKSYLFELDVTDWNNNSLEEHLIKWFILTLTMTKAKNTTWMQTKQPMPTYKQILSNVFWAAESRMRAAATAFSIAMQPRNRRPHKTYLSYEKKKQYGMDCLKLLVLSHCVTFAPLSLKLSIFTRLWREVHYLSIRPQFLDPNFNCQRSYWVMPMKSNFKGMIKNIKFPSKAFP